MLGLLALSLGLLLHAARPPASGGSVPPLPLVEPHNVGFAADDGCNIEDAVEDDGLSARGTGFRGPAEDRYAEVVDLTRFPIADLDGEVCQRIIAESQARWLANGSVDLIG